MKFIRIVFQRFESYLVSSSIRRHVRHRGKRLWKVHALGTIAVAWGFNPEGGTINFVSSRVSLTLTCTSTCAL